MSIYLDLVLIQGMLQLRQSALTIVIRNYLKIVFVPNTLGDSHIQDMKIYITKTECNAYHTYKMHPRLQQSTALLYPPVPAVFKISGAK